MIKGNDKIDICLFQWGEYYRAAILYLNNWSGRCYVYFSGWLFVLWFNHIAFVKRHRLCYCEFLNHYGFWSFCHYLDTIFMKLTFNLSWNQMFRILCLPIQLFAGWLLIFMFNRDNTSILLFVCRALLIVA